MSQLEIRNLHVQADDKQILRGVDLTVKPGEIHALMGPNGSGKSTLANAIMGHPSLEVTEGQILFDGQDITRASPDERAQLGLFMAFQYPVAIPGVTIAKYLRTVMNAHRVSRGEAEISLKEFRQTVEAAMALCKVPKNWSSRYLNDGFSGGEKKRLETLQLALQRPKTAILDETDSGLDIDALNTVAEGVNEVAKANGTGVLIITHYQRILHLVKPERVSILFEGRIVHEGGPELVERLEAEGYGWVEQQVGGDGVMTAPVAATHALDVAGAFPTLDRDGLVYLDSAATSQTPLPVLAAMDDYYRSHRASVHRGVYPLAEEATELYEGARAKAAAFVGWGVRRDDLHAQRVRGDRTSSPTPGHATTLGPGDRILLTEMEHHSNIVPWQLACEMTGATITRPPGRRRRCAGPARAGHRARGRRREARRGRARVERAGHDQPRRRHRRARACRRRRRARRRDAGGAAAPGGPAGDRRGLLRVDRPQGLRPDRHRPPARPAIPA